MPYLDVEKKVWKIGKLEIPVKEDIPMKEMKWFKDKYKDGGATAVFGATSKDLDILDPTARKISLSEEIKKNGGSLDMEQMIKLMNQ